MPIRPYPHLVSIKWNQRLIHHFHPHHIRNISLPSPKHLIAPRRNYSSDKAEKREADQDMLLVFASLSRPAMRIKAILPGNYLQHAVVCIRNQGIYYSFTSKGPISLQALCQIPVDSPKSLAQLINHSIGHDVHINLIYLRYITSLLSVIFV
jgi:hypothetical protein